MQDISFWLHKGFPLQNESSHARHFLHSNYSNSFVAWKQESYHDWLPIEASHFLLSLSPDCSSQTRGYLHGRVASRSNCGLFSHWPNVKLENKLQCMGFESRMVVGEKYFSHDELEHNAPHPSFCLLILKSLFPVISTLHWHKNMLQFLLISAHGRIPCDWVFQNLVCANLSLWLLDKEEINTNTRNCTMVLV